MGFRIKPLSFTGNSSGHTIYLVVLPFLLLKYFFLEKLHRYGDVVMMNFLNCQNIVINVALGISLEAICSHAHAQFSDKQIGGPGLTVEIDESLFGSFTFRIYIFLLPDCILIRQKKV